MSTRQQMQHAARLLIAGLDATYLSGQRTGGLAPAWADSRPTDTAATPYAVCGVVAHLYSLTSRWSIPVEPLLREVDEWTDSQADQQRRWGLRQRYDVYQLRAFVLEEQPGFLWQIADGTIHPQKAYDTVKEHTTNARGTAKQQDIARAREALGMLDARDRHCLSAEMLIADQSTVGFLEMAWGLLGANDKARLDEMMRRWRGEHPHVRWDVFNSETFPCGLGVEWPCTVDNIKRAYRQRALEVHPDMGGTNAKFHNLTEQYEAALAFAKRHAARWTSEPTKAKTA
jgi:DnaJ domain